MSALGPAFPTPHLYAPYFCEENAYHLARQFPGGQVVFITNSTQTVATFYQKASSVPLDQGAYVVWDYHVVVVHDGWVFDADSLLCSELPELHGVSVGTYFRFTFPLPASHPLAPTFRAVPAADFVQLFATDRRHMIRGGEMLKPPPPWDPICGPKATEHNLPLWLDLTYQGEGFGRSVPSRDELLTLLNTR